MFEVMENHQVARKHKFKCGFKQWVHGGGLRRVAAAAILLVVLIFVPNARTESNTALASNADQPTSPGLNCSDRGITLSFTAPTQTSPTVTNYEYFVSLGALSAEPASNDAGWKPLSPADSTSPVYISRTTLGLAAATHPNVYYYYLRAVFSDSTKSISWLRVVNDRDTRSNSVGCSWMGNIPASVPDAPQSLVATASNGSASISLTQGDAGTVAGITNYKYSIDGVNYSALSPADTSSPITIPGLTNGVSYTIYLKAVNSVGDSVASSSVSVVPVSGPPTVTSISPTSGTTAGGTSVTITGTNFISGATVTIGGSSCTSVVVVSSTSITCTTPSGTAGPQNVVVATGVSPNATLTGGFTYVAPPAAPATPDLATASDSGSSSTDDITSDNTPTISVGSATNGNTVTVTATKSGQTNVTCTFTATAETGCDLGTLVDGVWSVTAKQTASGIDSAATSALSITVDATRPTVTSFSSTKSNGTYGIGTTIDITATISEDVAVGASITVTLDTGDTVLLTRVTATTLTGTYTVGAGDNSADLTVSSYVLTSAPTDAVGNAMMSIALPTGANNIAGAQAIVVDTTPPTLRSATANTAGTQVTLLFNEPLNATTAVAGDFAVSVGTTSMTVSSISVSGSTVILTLGTPAAIGDVISVAYTAPTPNSATSNSAIQDTAGNDAISFTTTATVPSAPAPAPAPAPEPEPTPTTTVAPAPTVTPTKASAPKVLECKTAVGSKKSTAPILVGEKLSNGIIFNPDSPILDSTDKRELDRVTGVMAERGGLVLVSGFARKNGFDSAEYLRNLSLTRARNVSNYLVANGVRVSMRYEGYGAVTKDIGTSIERKVELRWIDDSEKIKYEKKCLNR
jgi:uncharacterized repeat protein (TIGR02059 family)